MKVQSIKRKIISNIRSQSACIPVFYKFKVIFQSSENNKGNHINDCKLP